jgi:hypothetical protein
MLRLRRAELANSDALPEEAGVEEVEEEEEKAGDGEREVREVSEGRGDEAAVLAGEAEAKAGAEVGRGAEAEAEEVNCSVGLCVKRGFCVRVVVVLAAGWRLCAAV